MAAYLLNFCANNRNPKLRYYASNIQLCGHIDASYLSVSKSRSRAAAYFYLSNNDGALVTPDHTAKLPERPNGAVHVMSTVMRQVLSSATEAEVDAKFYGCQESVPLCNTLSDLGHVQGWLTCCKEGRRLGSRRMLHQPPLPSQKRELGALPST